MFETDLVLVDHVMPGGPDFVGAVGESTGARVIVCSSHCAEEAVLAALQAGAVGVLRKDTLTTDSLATAVRAAANGTGVVTPELLRDLLDGLAAGIERPVVARLTDREQQVLSLIAEGHPTREVAERLCYSERTVKNVLHDVVTKLGARSRSQAVAHAVREGLISDAPVLAAPTDGASTPTSITDLIAGRRLSGGVGKTTTAAAIAMGAAADGARSPW